jgi:hypothetical protein
MAALLIEQGKIHLKRGNRKQKKPTQHILINKFFKQEKNSNQREKNEY